MPHKTNCKHTIQFVLLPIRLTLTLVLIGWHSHSVSATLNEVNQATELIRKTSIELCSSVRDAGSVQRAEVSGRVQGGLEGLFHRLANIGVSVEAKRDVSQYQGVLQSDLATAIKNQNECKLAVMTKLLATMFPSTPSGSVGASYVGYTPSNNFDKELAFFLEISGVRLTFQAMLNQWGVQLEELVSQERPDDAAYLGNFRKIYAQETSSMFEEFVTNASPIYRRYFNIEDLQELNKFYSTPQMRKLVSKQPSMLQEAFPIGARLGEQLGRRIAARMGN